MPATTSSRARDAARKRQEREQERTLPRRDVANPARRRAALADAIVFLQTYLGHRFDQEFTPDRQAMISAILEALQTRTAQAVAAPRESGKTSIVVGLVMYCILRGEVRFALMLAATETHAQERLLDNLKSEFETNELLAEDFPEICDPIHDVSLAPNRAAAQRYDGKLTRIQWTRELLRFPETMDGLDPEQPSPAAGVVVRSRGITSSLRGLNVRGRRPDLVIIDDPDDEESADSPALTAKLVNKINRSIGALGRAGKGLARVMLCTIINRQCAAFLYTDPTINPAWNGRRYRAVDAWPDRMDLWEAYVERLKEGQAHGDRFGRAAHQFYLDNRVSMDAGAVVTNPYQFENAPLADGSVKEVSALQHCFNVIASIGMEAFQTEFQNDPPEPEGDDTANTVNERIVKGTDARYTGRVNGLERRAVPADAGAVTMFIDVGKRVLHWAAVAWSDGAKASVLDYDIAETSAPDVVGTEVAVYEALCEVDAWLKTQPFVRIDTGEAMAPCDVLIDVGAQFATADTAVAERVVYRFIMEHGRPYRASKGDPHFRMPMPDAKGKKPGTERWYQSWQGSLWVLTVDPNYWKKQTHERFMKLPVDDSGEQQPGTIRLFGRDAREHRVFAEHICAEKWVEEFKEGKQPKAGFVRIRRANHWLDCMSGCLLAGSMHGFTITKPKPPRPRYTLSEMKKNRGY